MTTTKMEEAITNIDARTTRIEQVLPTLATKDDIKAAREHAEALAKDARLHATILYEDIRDTLKTIRENTAPPGRDR